MMAKDRTLCYHCGIESENVFKYYDNRKQTQPRYQCANCQKFFTAGFHGRVQGRTYTKQRNVDPPELKGLSRECRFCGVADNAPFKYYNNKNTSQPRFKCLSCKQQFQMHVVGSGEERRLVHSHQRTLRNQKLGQAPNSMSALNFDNEIRAAQTSVDPWMQPVLGEAEDFPASRYEDEDLRYLDLIEAALNNESEICTPASVDPWMQSVLGEVNFLDADFPSFS